MQIAYANTASVQTTWHILCITPPRSTTPRHTDMAGSWRVVTVALSATRDLLSWRIYLHQGQLKRARKMIARRGMRKEMMMYRGGGGIHRNLMIQYLVRQNALIRTDHISQGHIDSSVTMS